MTDEASSEDLEATAPAIATADVADAVEKEALIRSLLATDKPVDLEAGSDIPVRYEVRGKAVDFAAQPKFVLKQLAKAADKQRKKYASKVGAEGERPSLVLKKPDLVGLTVTVVLEYPEAMAGSIKGHKKATRVA
jgi:hypothetical protein